MSDFDTRRIGEIAELEAKIRALQTQLRDSQVSSDKWEPKFHGEYNVSEGGRITLSFGGKRLTVLLPIANLQNGDLTTNTTDVLMTFAEKLIIDQMRPVVEPEVERLMKNAQSLKQVGNW